MALLQTDARLFGLDLSTLWPEIRAAGAAMWNWPVLSWLTPQPPIGFIRADGSVAVITQSAKPKSRKASAANARAASPLASAIKRAAFFAVQLPEDVLLRHHIALPVLPSAALQSALALEVQRLSPFAPAATVWAYFPVQPTAANNAAALQQWMVVLTSHELVQAHLQSLEPQLKGIDLPKLEIWVAKKPSEAITATTASASDNNAAELANEDPHAYALIPGFGEAYRRQRQRLGRYINMGLVGMVLLLLAAIALTPTLQLRMRALDAQEKFQALQQTVAPLQQQREAMVQAQSQLQSMAKIAGQPAIALKVINALTTAIPDDTHLQSLQIDAGDAAVKAPKVTIMGQTGNAAALMQHLGQQPGVQNVKAPSPAVRPLGAPKETFTIEMTVDLSALEGVVSPAAAATQPPATPSPPAAPATAANTSVFGR